MKILDLGMTVDKSRDKIDDGGGVLSMDIPSEINTFVMSEWNSVYRG